MDYLKGDERYLWHSNRDFNPLNFDKNILLTEAFENTFKDQYGNEYIDMLSAGGCALFSLSDVEEATKVAGEVKLGAGYFEGFTNKYIIDLAEDLSNILPVGLGRFIFSNSSQSAKHIAMKMSLMANAISGYKEKKSILFVPLGTSKNLALYTCDGDALRDADIIFGKADNMQTESVNDVLSSDIDQYFQGLKRIFKQKGHRISAILVEPYTLFSYGSDLYKAEYMRELRNLCDIHKIHMIINEQYTGLGKTCKYFYSDYLNVAPEFLLLGESLTSGIAPIGLTVTTESIYEIFNSDRQKTLKFIHNSPNTGNAFSAAIANNFVLKLSKRGYLDDVKERAKKLYVNLKNDLEEHRNVSKIINLGFINLIQMVDVKSNEAFDESMKISERIVKKALENGIILASKENMLVLNPALDMSLDDIKKATKRIQKSIVEVLG